MNEGGRTPTDRPTGASAPGERLPVGPAVRLTNENAAANETDGVPSRVAHRYGPMVGALYSCLPLYRRLESVGSGLGRIHSAVILGCVAEASRSCDEPEASVNVCKPPSDQDRNS